MRIEQFEALWVSLPKMKIWQGSEEEDDRVWILILAKVHAFHVLMGLRINPHQKNHVSERLVIVDPQPRDTNNRVLYDGFRVNNGYVIDLARLNDGPQSLEMRVKACRRELKKGLAGLMTSSPESLTRRMRVWLKNSSSPVRVVSGGLPSLGKRR